MTDVKFIEKSIEQLKVAGCRITQPRLLVLELLAKTKIPLSSQELHDQLSAKGKSIDLVSVYRILDVLHELDLVHRDAESGNYFPCSHCKHCPDNIHIFLKCIDCSKVREIDFHGEVFADSFKRKLAKLKSKPSKETIYLSDLCESCN